jgi:hypothetical protein
MMDGLVIKERGRRKRVSLEYMGYVSLLFFFTLLSDWVCTFWKRASNGGTGHETFFFFFWCLAFPCAACSLYVESRDISKAMITSPQQAMPRKSFSHAKKKKEIFPHTHAPLYLIPS